MKSVIILESLAGLSLLVALVFFVLHFTCQWDAFWFSVPIACAAVLSLISSVQYLKIKKRGESRENSMAHEDTQNK